MTIDSPPAHSSKTTNTFRGAGDLDEHNGRFAVTPEFPEGTYAYFLATADDGRMEYPYLIGPTYKGEYAAEDVSRLHRFGEDSQLTLLGADAQVRAGIRHPSLSLAASPCSNEFTNS